MKKLTALVLMLCTLFSVVVPCFAGTQTEGPFAPEKPLYTQYYMLVSLDTEAHTVLTQKNAEKRKYPASLTKIATAMVVLESGKALSSTVTVSKRAIQIIRNTGAQTAGLKPGQRVSVEELLSLALVFSACDACQVLAEAVGGTEKKFVQKMNAWASSVGCSNTHFVNPDGLHHKKQYSTVADITKMALKALENEDFVRISSIVNYKFRGIVYPHTNYALHKTMKQYYYPYMQGIKTGYTKQAGRCLVTTAEKNKHRYLAVLMDAPLKLKKDKNGRVVDQINLLYADAKTLFNWAFEGFTLETVLKAGATVQTATVWDAKKEEVALVAETSVALLLPKSVDTEQIEVLPKELPERLMAPLRQGEIVGEAEIVYRGQVLATVTLLAGKTVKASVLRRGFRIAYEWVRNLFAGQTNSNL